MTFGMRLKIARERKGLTQAEVQRITSISDKSLSRYENNASSPDPETIAQLIRLYDVSADYILGLTNVSVSVHTAQFTPHEQKVVEAYRAKPEMQPAVDTLLGIAEAEKESAAHSTSPASSAGA